DLVYRDDNGDFRGLGMGDGLYGLRHDAVVGRNYEDRDIRDACAARSHGCKGGVAGGIEKSDLALLAFMVHFNLIGADVLRYAAELAGNDVGLADSIQK